jgi:glycosyltransferase involved in cell wall biosynthesis
VTTGCDSRVNRRIVFLVSPSPTPCGIEMFARGLACAVGRAGRDAQCVAVTGERGDAGSVWRALAGARAIVVSLPVVAWKRALLTPLLALALARARGARTIVVLHEWADLHPLRRAFLSIYLLFAQTILFSSPIVREAYARSALGRLSFAGGLMPIPPNIAPPEARNGSPLLERIRKERACGSLIIGHFGAIYPKKQSTFVLDVAHALEASGRKAFAAFIGGFVKANDNVEELFLAHAQRLNLESSIAVSGYVESDAEIFALFDAVDVFVYSFAEGLTSRRGSILTCMESGRPVIVNAPRYAGEFDHHPTFRNLIARGALRLLPPDANPGDFAQAIFALVAPPASNSDMFRLAWRDAAAALCVAIDAWPVTLASSVAVR